MIAGQGEVRTDNKAISATVERGGSSILRGRKDSGTHGPLLQSTPQSSPADQDAG